MNKEPEPTQELWIQQNLGSCGILLNKACMQLEKKVPTLFYTIWRSWFASSLALFRARLDGGLSNLVHWKMSLPMAEGSKVPSNLNHPMVL